MKKLVKSLGVLLGGAALIAGCVSNEDLGVKNKVLTEAESPVRFNYPPVEGGFRKILAGKSANHRQKYVSASFGPKRGTYPAINIWFRKLTDVNYFFPRRSFEEHMGSVFDVVPAHDEAGFVVHKLGQANYATYRENGGHCMFFYVKWGGHLASQGGNRMIDGIFCDSTPIDAAKADKVINSIEILNNGEVIEVAKADMAVAKAGTHFVSREKIGIISIEWPGTFQKKDIQVTYRMYTLTDGILSFSTGQTGECSGDFILEHEMKPANSGLPTKGEWELECSLGQSASGWLKAFLKSGGNTDFYGAGKDGKDGKITFAS